MICFIYFCLSCCHKKLLWGEYVFLWLAIKKGNVHWFCLRIQYFYTAAKIIKVARQRSKLTGSLSKIYCGSSMHSSNSTLPFLMWIIQHTDTVLYMKLPPIILSYLNTYPSSRKTRIISRTKRQAIIKEKKMEWCVQSVVPSVNGINQFWRSWEETEKNKIKTEKDFILCWFLQIWVILTGAFRHN